MLRKKLLQYYSQSDMNMDHNSKKVVTRFAPSPTGFMHIGGVRTALYAYLFAKKNNGTFILRIEDTDKNREVEGSIAHIQESLQWLGLEWDFGPNNPGEFNSCLQSDRLDIYKKYADELIEKGHAYPDPYTAEELAVFREQAENEKRPFLYRNHRPTEPGVWDGTKALRFKVPVIKRYTWHDEVRGELTAGEEMLDDVILIKADGYPTYNFAHIVDDLEMGVTHVMRGEEFISSTPKFLSIYDAMEIPYPKLVTLPPIMGPDGKKKLSKRDGAKDLLEYKADGYLPEAMRNFLALVGWNPGGEQEMYRSSADDSALIDAFSIEKIQRSGGAFNEEKLLWMNKEYLKLQTSEFQTQYFTEALPETLKTKPLFSEETLAKLAPIAFERIHNKVEITQTAEAGEYDWAFEAPQYETELLKWKNDDTAADAAPRLMQALTLLTEADFETSESIKSALWAYAEEVGKGELLWPLRTCLSGKAQSPDPFTLAFVLGKSETLSRIQTACDKIVE
jgi:nondiscriminating glutamyl-tRNA synthetase